MNLRKFSNFAIYSGLTNINYLLKSNKRFIYNKKEDLEEFGKQKLTFRE